MIWTRHEGIEERDRSWLRQGCSREEGVGMVEA